MKVESVLCITVRFLFDMFGYYFKEDFREYRHHGICLGEFLVS